MHRQIEGFHQDDLGDWVADLVCGHGQHVRHRPPFQLRPWILDSSSREERIASILDCHLCDAGEIPDRARFVGVTKSWNEETVPSSLKERHRLAQHVWGVLDVQSGQVGLMFGDSPISPLLLGPGSSRAIPPEVDHQVVPMGRANFFIRLYDVNRSDEQTLSCATRDPSTEDDEGDLGGADVGGDAACWAHLLCPECGTLLGEDLHLPGCQLATAAQAGEVDSHGDP